jgi:D-3-phosphoglycerate dehydrogenase
MENRPKVVRVDRTIDPNAIKEEREELDKVNAELVLAEFETEEDIIKATKGADAILTTFAPITRRVMESSPKVRVVVRYGIGYDTVDADAATDNGILVVNLPGFCLDEVADHTIGLILACVRKIVYYNNLTKSGYWARYHEMFIHSFTGQTLGLVGCGTIGQAVAKRAVGFDLKILGTDPYVDKAVAQKHGITLVSMEELLRESDFVSVHSLLNKDTYHLMGEKEFRQMKPTAYLINTSRGPVVDEQALIKALQEKRFAGAGIDVFEQEPVNPDNPLLKMDNVVVTPHNAGWSDAAGKRARILVGREAARVVSGKYPSHWVNKSVKPRFPLVKGN